MAMRLGLLAAAVAGVAAFGQAPQGPRADHHQHLFGPTIVARATTPMEMVDAARLITLLDEAGIRQLGVHRVLWGADGAAGGTTPAAAWKAFSETPLTPAELETIRTNVAPYLK